MTRVSEEETAMSGRTVKTRDSREVQAELVRRGLTKGEAERVIYGVDDSGSWEDPDRGVYVYRDFDLCNGYYEVGVEEEQQR